MIRLEAWLRPMLMQRSETSRLGYATIRTPVFRKEICTGCSLESASRITFRLIIGPFNPAGSSRIPIVAGHLCAWRAGVLAAKEQN